MLFKRNAQQIQSRFMFFYPDFIPILYQFYEDKICGKGKYTYQNGDVYEGYFNDEEQKHGSGTLYMMNSDKFVGEFPLHLL